MKCEEAQERITALVDKELSDLERSSIESHLKGCPSCQRAYEEERALKQALSMAGASIKAPASLREKILSDQRIFPQRVISPEGWKKPFRVAQPFLRPVLALALLVVLLLPILYLMQPPTQPIALAALEIQEKIAGGELSLRKTANLNELRDWQIRAVEGKFAPMEYDLSSRHIQPVGGVVQDMNGRKMLVTVYSGDIMSVTCFTFLGTEQDAPKNAAVFFDPEKKIKFYTFSHGDIHGVLHREGNVICILVSKMPMMEILALARAKAQPS